MFKGLINDAKSAIAEIITRYATRAVIGVLFVIAIAFAIAAITVQLVNHFGAVAAYWMVAGGFAMIAVIGIVAEGWREKKEEDEAEKAAQHDTEALASSAAAQAAVQLPIALVGTLLTSSAGPLSALGIMRFLGRNFSLVVLLMLIGMLFWPQEDAAGNEQEAFARPLPREPVV